MPTKKKIATKLQKAWIVTVDMGYGHQRAAYPLKSIAQGGIITANNYPGIPDADRRLWESSRTFYEFISRFKKVPLVGPKAFDLFDRLQSIPQFYPRRDLSASNVQVEQMYGLFKRQEWGKHLITKLAKNPLPFVTTFFATAFMADYFEYPGDIYCIATDTDISRAWVALEPKKSRIIYLAPNKRVVERLKLYGVRPSQIIYSGFPLPEENVGFKLATLKADLGRRLIQLDPQQLFISQYAKLLHQQLGRKTIRKKPVRPLTITFAVGGAGAQRELGVAILKSLRKEIIAGRIRINLVAGVHHVVNQYFKDALKKLKMSNTLNNGVDIIFQATKDQYFTEFNKILRETDIIWTKPSELSFYCALGIPIIMAPPIGSQEIFNQKWLQSIGAGINQEDPRYTNEWLIDWLDSGWLAEAAMQGYLEGPKYGTYNTHKIIFKRPKEAKQIKSILQY